MPPATLPHRFLSFVGAVLHAAAIGYVGLSGSGVQGQVLSYGAVDLATVRVFALKGIEAQRVSTGTHDFHTVAVPIIGHGSGVLVRADGLVLTAHHVVAQASALAVRVPGRSRAYPAEVVYADSELDFAILIVPGYFEHVVPLEGTPRALRVREAVHAIGYPVDSQLEHPLSSPGIIAGSMGDGRLQLGISLNPGNSGGPLIDKDDQLLGIVVARGDPTKGVLGMGVATPIEPVRQVLENLDVRLRVGTFSPETDHVAELVVRLAASGPVGLLREAAAALHGETPLGQAQQLESLASLANNPDLLALSAAYTWDALVVRLVDVGASDDFTTLAPSERSRVTGWLQQVVHLCHLAVQRDPSLRRRSGFVDYVVQRWPAPKRQLATATALSHGCASIHACR